MKKLKLIAYAVMMLVVLSAFKRDNVVTIFMIGDSTMANKSLKGGARLGNGPALLLR